MHSKRAGLNIPVHRVLACLMSGLPIFRHERRDCVRMQKESRNSMVRAIFVLW